MNRVARLVAGVAGLVLLLSNAPSWGQPTCHSPGCNPTVSDANDNTAGGSNALKNVDETPNTGGLFNTAFGSGALFSVVTGSSNTAFGNNALSNNTADNNTALGLAVLESNDTGHDNTGTGFAALISNTTGSGNTANGSAALITNTTGSDNTASGASALNNNDTGNNNTASGANALTANTTGNLNTATGFQALFTNATGANNTASGAKALKKATGTKNIGIGFQAGVSLITGNNNIYIGNQGAGDEFQTIRIGTAQMQTFMAGIAGNTSVSNASPVVIDVTTGQLGIATVVSSVRYKREIEAMGGRSTGLLQLRPVTFAYKSDAPGATHYGLIAEEVQKVYPELVTHTPTGEVQGILYQELIPMLLNELQRQRQEFQQALQLQQQKIAELRALVGQGRETASLSR